MHSPRTFATIALLHSVLAAPALAKPADAGSANAEAANAQAERAQLNREQASAAQAQLRANAASKQAYDTALVDFDRAMARWKADAIACRDGDLSRCR